MPIYEYRCAECHAEFEVWQKMSDKPVHKCEKCGSRKVSKLISQTSFQLKGTGWYVTDYAKKGGPKSGAESKSNEKTSEKKTDASASCAKAASGECGAAPACGAKKGSEKA
jgi:putative FmdB family regulatory protein